MKKSNVTQALKFPFVLLATIAVYSFIFIRLMVKAMTLK